MAELPITDFTYSLVQRHLQEARFDQAIAALSQRIETQPDDRMARLLLLLANVSQFGTGPFNRQIEEVRLFADLSSNERHVVRQIFLACFQHAERDGQTIQKMVYQRLIRRLMLNQPLDISITEARQIEESVETSSSSASPALSPSTAMSSDVARPEPFIEAPRRLHRWDEFALIGAGAMIVIVLLGFYVKGQRRTPVAQNPSQLISLISGEQSDPEITAVSTRPTAILAPSFTTEPLRMLLLKQLGGLNQAYARWTDADPTTSGTVLLKLKVEPAGKISKIEEVVSRLSEHRFLEVIIAEAKLWKLPHSGTAAAEVSVPLIFNPRTSEPSQQPAETPLREPPVLLVQAPAPAAAHTTFALEEAEPADLQVVAKKEPAAKPRGSRPLERAADTELVVASKQKSDSPDKRAVNREPAAALTADTETEISRTAALKHEPRFAAEAIENVGRGTRVTVLRKERDWIQVKVKSSGNVGYLRKEYLVASHSLR
jgi:hypothetical protein